MVLIPRCCLHQLVKHASVGTCCFKLQSVAGSGPLWKCGNSRQVVDDIDDDTDDDIDDDTDRNTVGGTATRIVPKKNQTHSGTSELVSPMPSPETTRAEYST
jgi:hypothetical protein